MLCAACDKSRLHNVAKLQGHILTELNNVERMIQSQLRGNLKVMDEEMKLMHGAEAAAKRNEEIEAAHAAKSTHGTQLLQQTAGEGLNKDASLLGEAKTEVEKLLHGHPVELQKEEQALNEAMSAIHGLSKPVAAFVETKTMAASRSETMVSVAMLEEQRSSSMATAVRAKRSYATAEGKIATLGGSILSQFGILKDAIAQAFAGKDSKAVQTAMEVGEMVDGARAKQQEVVKMSVAEAAKAKREAATQEAAFAQMSAQSKEVQEQHAYMSGMARLATEEKSTIGKFSDLKGAVAQAFAGKDSNAVEKAMQVGELLDKARQEQQDVMKRDQKEASSAHELFKKLDAHA